MTAGMGGARLRRTGMIAAAAADGGALGPRSRGRLRSRTRAPVTPTAAIPTLGTRTAAIQTLGTALEARAGRSTRMPGTRDRASMATPRAATPRAATPRAGTPTAGTPRAPTPTRVMPDRAIRASTMATGTLANTD